MKKFVLMSLFVSLVALPAALAVDGTIEGAAANSGSGESGTVSFSEGNYTITPFESVSIDSSSTWQDNRHRAYWNGRNVNGFLLFDVTQIPDTETITKMTLRCYLENAFGSPSSNPVVDVYYSADDGWTRTSVTGGSLSLDTLLADNIPFTTYITSYDFELNVAAHDWSTDLADNQICIGFTNDVSYYSYVYFFGAYGSPTGPPPELIIETGPGGFNLAVSPDPLVAGQTGTFTATNGDANVNTYLAYSLVGSGSTYVPFLNVTLDLTAPKQGGPTVVSDPSGTAVWNLTVPAGAAGRNVWLQAVQYGNVSNLVATSIL